MICSSVCPPPTTRYFDALHIPDYARSGATASATVVLDEGPLEQFSHAIEPQLRALGLPTALKRGNLVNALTHLSLYHITMHSLLTQSLDILSVYFFVLTHICLDQNLKISSNMCYIAYISCPDIVRMLVIIIFYNVEVEWPM